MGRDSLAFASAVELARLIKEKELSPVELVDLFLKRIEGLNPKLNAYLTVTGEEAREAAQKAEKASQQGEQLPPLFGVPVSIKDTFATRGIRTTRGSLVYANSIPDTDAISVERLLKAGAIILGKTNTPEIGLSPTTENNLGEDCCNPWNTDRVTGGSSGGAAVAVAAGMAPLSIGGDSGGSIRIPASFCGVYGIKPTNRLVSSLFSGMPLFGCQGPITRTVADAALMLNAIAGPDPRDPYCLSEQPPDYVKALESKNEIGRLKVAWSLDLGYAAVDPEVASVTEAAARSFEAFGCSVEEASPDIWDAFPTSWVPIAWADEYASYAELIENQELSSILTSYARRFLEAGKRVTGVEYGKAIRELLRFRKKMEDFFNKYDLLLTPTLATTAFPRHQRAKGVDIKEINPHLFYPSEIGGKRVHPHYGFHNHTPAFNMTGQPAATVPCGFSSDGLPIGLQIVGRCKEDATVLQASAAFEEAHPWADKRPPVS
jgi:Asp-tRNA(Asn)/Glu-tRNA(Gln) amidotransferase A subunit family amidase